MTNHGFGGGKFLSRKIPMATIEKIAECISNVSGITWAHVVHEGFDYDSSAGEPKMNHNTDVEDRYDLIFEMKHKCDLNDIKKCTQECAPGHNICIDVITVKDQSYEHGKPGKHPKTID